MHLGNTLNINSIDNIDIIQMNPNRKNNAHSKNARPIRSYNITDNAAKFNTTTNQTPNQISNQTPSQQNQQVSQPSQVSGTFVRSTVASEHTQPNVSPKLDPNSKLKPSFYQIDTVKANTKVPNTKVPNTKVPNTKVPNTDLPLISNPLKPADEIKEWFDAYSFDKIKLLNHDSNIITMSIESKSKIHIVEITYPKSYPRERSGFKVSERKQTNVHPLPFVIHANKQYADKKLSIAKVLTHLVKPIRDHTLIEPNNSSQMNNSLTGDSQMVSSSSDVVNDWFDNESGTTEVIKEVSSPPETKDHITEHLHRNT